MKKIINDEIIEKLDFIYPSTLNIYINKKNIFNGISEIILKNINYGKSLIGESKKICINFIDNNFSKDFSLNDIFEVIYIDNLYRLFKYNGFDITKQMYFNDVSSEVEICANNTKEEYYNICLSKKIRDDYVEINQVARNIYSLYGENKKEEDIDFFKKEFVRTSLENRKRKLDSYRINFNVYNSEERLYENGLVEYVLDRLNKKGYTYFNNDELWVRVSEYGDEINQNLVKKDGTYTILLSQLANCIEKLRKDYDGIVNVYSNEYIEYKTIIKDLLKKIDQDINRIDIKVLPKLEFLMDGNIQNKTEILNKFDVNTIRYLCASQKNDNIMKIDLDNLSNEYDNPVFYIEKTYSLIHNVLRNYKKKITKVSQYNTMDNEKAYILLEKIYEFENIVILSCLKQMPKLICDYVYDLSESFNDYYNSEEVINEDEVYTNERLNLLLAVKIVINNSLDLIGIIPREEF